VVKFLRGERNKPKDNVGVVTFVVGRELVGKGDWTPRFPAAYLKITVGVVPAAQQSTEIANMLQEKVLRRLLITLPDEKYTAEDCGVFYYARYGQIEKRAYT
jgi:hypothetical protein